MKDKKLYTVIWNEDLKEIKNQLKGDPLAISLVFYSTFGTYENRAAALDRMQIMNKIYKRDEGINLATNIVEH